MKIINNRRGVALIAIYVVIAAILVFAGAYFTRSFHEFRFAERQSDEQKAYYAAEAGLNEVAMDIYHTFRASNEWQNNRNTTGFRLWFGYPDSEPGWDATRRRNTFLANYGSLPTMSAIDNYQYRVVLPSAAADPIIPTDDGALVKLIAIGIAPHRTGAVNRMVAVTVSYEMAPSPIFNYAYFINNFGWLWGGGIRVNGDVRSNGNFSFNGNPMVNGDIYAATNPDLGAAGTITGNTRNLTVNQYHSQASGRARPTDPTDLADPGGTTYEGGYEGTSTRYENQEVLEMPYLGDLTTYKNLAHAKNGSISQGAAVLVNEVYSGDGPDGLPGTADDGSMILVGTAANPIVINGPVVVEGDVVIRGVVSGQGTIYAGRNTHIIGDITYNSPPNWPKPDATPAVTTAANSTTDFVGFACKGNVIIGDYTRNDWQANVTRYLRPPFTQGYETDSTDATLGYDSDGDPANGYWFDGNYTVFDGGLKDDGAGGSEQRRYYESSISDAQIRSISAPSNQIRNVDGILYNNHAFTGRVGRFAINGSMVARDEAIIYSGSIDMNYDMRALNEGVENIDIYLPRDLTFPETRVTQSGA
ncbi:MAG: hypothetical protein HQ572_06445 [Candidatus Omnitrophica bacterium]|nr:hypothetical protein [Candidatus Omnitrophota bacterium]